jgi:hypothetical protein
MPIHLYKGNDPETLKANVRILKRSGWPKEKTIYTVLALAGYHESPDSPPSTKSSSDTL